MRFSVDRAALARMSVLFCVLAGCVLYWSAQAAAAGAPTVEGESFADVGSGSAALSAQVDPQGSPTVYYFEYGTSEAYGSKTSEVSIGAQESALSTPAQLNGLVPQTEYHFRVVAVSAAGVTHGADVMFKTLVLGILGLPDGRVFERVTPPNDENADVYTPAAYKFQLPLSEGNFTEKPFQAAADGDAVAYAGQPSTGGIGTGGPGWGNEYLATRSGGGGWSQVNIQPGGYFHATYQAFSSDLAVGFLSATSENGLEDGLPPLAPEAPGKYKVLYAHSNPNGAYQPFFTKSATLHRSSEEFGVYDAGESGLGAEDPPVYAGSSANREELLFEANDALAAPAVEGASEEENDLYVSDDGRLSVVNVLPDGSSDTNATFGAPPFQGRGKELPDFSHVISADGSRVFWTDLATGDLYVRESPTASGARTVLLSEGGRYWTATADGSQVFFTKGNLYAYDFEAEGGKTVDLTPGVEVIGVIGASENGEYVYYVDSSDELEVWHDGGSKYIATLSSQDGEGAGPFTTQNSQIGDWQPGLGHRTAAVAPDGHGVVFMSNQKLKAVGYPNGYANEGLYEIYVYEAESGQLFCASCVSSGEPPQANPTITASEESGRGSAAILPISFSDTYLPRWISEGGERVFFDSAEPLVPQDTDGKLDVYEWERDGAGSCREADGCVYLLSAGTGGSASWLLDASVSGDDVFIISRTELVPGDPYDSFDVYDARAGGVQPLAPPACTGTGCQGVPPAPPIFATPASVTFAGVGNFPAPSTSAAAPKGKPKAKVVSRARKLADALKTCRSERKPRRRACEAQARRRYAVKAKAKKSTTRPSGR
jgi:hypothetical protein